MEPSPHPPCMGTHFGDPRGSFSEFAAMRKFMGAMRRPMEWQPMGQGSGRGAAYTWVRLSEITGLQPVYQSASQRGADDRSGRSVEAGCASVAS